MTTEARPVEVREKHTEWAKATLRRMRLAQNRGNVSALSLAFAAFEQEVMEQCARVAEEHQEHMDFTNPQDHTEPPFRCNVAQAIRAKASHEHRFITDEDGAVWPCACGEPYGGGGK